MSGSKPEKAIMHTSDGVDSCSDDSETERERLIDDLAYLVVCQHRYNQRREFDELTTKQAEC